MAPVSNWSQVTLRRFLQVVVSALNRLPFFMQALSRRLLCLPLSCYFDDITCQDFSSMAVRSQHLVEEMFAMFGYPFAEAKCQLPEASGDFLGQLHCLQSWRLPFRQ